MSLNKQKLKLRKFNSFNLKDTNKENNKMKFKYLEESFNNIFRNNRMKNPINTLLLKTKSFKSHQILKNNSISNSNIYKFKSIIKEKNEINKKYNLSNLPSYLHKTKTSSYFSLNKKLINLDKKIEKNHINLFKEFKNGRNYEKYKQIIKNNNSISNTNNINKEKYIYKKYLKKKLNNILSPSIKSKIFNIYKTLDNFDNSKTSLSFDQFKSHKYNNIKISNYYDNIKNLSKKKYFNKKFNKLIKCNINDFSLNSSNKKNNKNKIKNSLSDKFSLKKQIKKQKNIYSYINKIKNNKNEITNFNEQINKEEKEYNKIINNNSKMNNNKIIIDNNNINDNEIIQSSVYDKKVNNKKVEINVDINKENKLNLRVNNYLNKYKGNQKKIMKEIISKLNFNYSDDNYNYNYMINYNNEDIYNKNMKIKDENKDYNDIINSDYNEQIIN